MHTLLQRIERYLDRTETPATRFGRRAVNDPRLVEDLRRGRECRPPTAQRIERYLVAHGEAAR